MNSSVYKRKPFIDFQSFRRSWKEFFIPSGKRNFAEVWTDVERNLTTASIFCTYSKNRAVLLRQSFVLPLCVLGTSIDRTDSLGGQYLATYKPPRCVSSFHIPQRLVCYLVRHKFILFLERDFSAFITRCYACLQNCNISSVFESSVHAVRVCVL